MTVSGPHAYRVLDVFTETALEGNPLAVIPDAREVDPASMQRVAREFNLSETVFILPPHDPRNAARLRIFTPAKEMQFAGHPTVGAAFVLLDLGIVPSHVERFTVEEGVGDVAVRVERSDRKRRLWLTTPPIVFGQEFDRRLCAAVLGLEPEALLGPAPQLASAGNPTIFVAVRDRQAVDRAWLDLAGMRELHRGATSGDCVFVFAPVEEGVYSRMFGPEHGVVEDPATGSSTGPLAAYMIRHGLLAGRDGERFVSEQGTRMGRRSLLHVLVHSDAGAYRIEVGGDAVTVAEGTLRW